MMSQVKQSLYETLERLDDEQVQLILAFATSLQKQNKKSLTLERLAQDTALSSCPEPTCLPRRRADPG